MWKAQAVWGEGGDCLFFQAEDGIRNLVRSRGLGDVYKRQDQRYTFTEQIARLQAAAVPLDVNPANIPKIISHNMPYFHRTYRDYSHYALDTEEHFAEFSLVFSSLLGSDYDIIESGIRAGLLYDQNRIQDALSLVDENPVSVSPELEFLSRMQIASCILSL